jgi:hypothetical protein
VLVPRQLPAQALNVSREFMVISCRAGKKITRQEVSHKDPPVASYDLSSVELLLVGGRAFGL